MLRQERPHVRPEWSAGGEILFRRREIEEVVEICRNSPLHPLHAADDHGGGGKMARAGDTEARERKWSGKWTEASGAGVGG